MNLVFKILPKSDMEVTSLNETLVRGRWVRNAGFHIHFLPAHDPLQDSMFSSSCCCLNYSLEHESSCLTAYLLAGGLIYPGERGLVSLHLYRYPLGVSASLLPPQSGEVFICCHRKLF